MRSHLRAAMLVAVCIAALAMVWCGVRIGPLEARAAQSRHKVQRYGMAIGIKPERIAEYKKLHANAWPGVLSKIRKCHIRNYSIYLAELEKGKYYLFGYFEYTGGNFAADMKAMAADATTVKWWKQTDPCQIPLPTRKKGEKMWLNMREVFHTD